MIDELARVRKTRNYSAFHLWNLSWEDFSREGFVRRVDNLHGFTFAARLSGLGRWTGLIEANRVALSLHGAIEEALTSAKFVNIPALETSIETERLVFRYRDTDYGFDLSFHGDGSVVLERDGSTLRTFHRWYTSFMPTLPVILDRAIAAFDEELQRTVESPNDLGASKSRATEDVPERVRLLTASFKFDVVCHRLRDHSASPSRNLDVMKKNVQVRLPDASGRLTEGESIGDFSKYGRMDYRVGLRHEIEPYITQFMEVRAPSNSGWSGLFFTLSYVGANFADNSASNSTDERIALNPKFVLSSAACADAYISFFRDMGLEGFVASVTAGFDFNTTAASLA